MVNAPRIEGVASIRDPEKGGRQPAMPAPRGALASVVFRYVSMAAGALGLMLAQSPTLAASDRDDATKKSAERRVEPVPARLGLAPFYQKYVDAQGLPVVGSAKVSDFALLEAAYLIDHMLAKRPDIREAMIRNKVRLAVMASSERTTDIPEHHDLTPRKYWDRRARGLGATPDRPAVSCGEENLLGYQGDPYAAENILIHEFAHAIHEMGLKTIDHVFDGRLDKVYQAALAKGLWKGTYAATNRDEYWAEGVQSWFDTNRPPDHDHNHVDTREELEKYDPDLAKLIAEVFRDQSWRYQRPKQRTDKEHLQGFDPQKAPAFSWE